MKKLKNTSLRDSSFEIFYIICNNMSENFKRFHLKSKWTYVDYYASRWFKFLHHLQSNGPLSYCISRIDGLDKKSDGYANCTGVIASGVSKENETNISFLSHQNHLNFQNDYQAQFILDLKAKLIKIKNLSIKGTLDVKIFGGWSLDTNSAREYHRSIRMLSDTVELILGYKPIVVSGPKIIECTENVYFDTENRELLVSRDHKGNEQVSCLQPYIYSEKTPVT